MCDSLKHQDAKKVLDHCNLTKFNQRLSFLPAMSKVSVLGLKQCRLRLPWIIACILDVSIACL